MANITDLAPDMGAQETNQQSTPKLLTKVRSALAVGRPEKMMLALLCVALLVWFTLSRIASYIYPDMAVNSSSAAGSYLAYAARNGLLFLMLVGLFSLFRLMRTSGGGSFLAYLRENIENYKPALIAVPFRIIFGILTFGVFIFAYSTIKTRIPEMTSYSWDQAFMEWDRLLFFGRDGWQVFAWIYDIPVIIRAMDFIYDAWAMLLVGTWVMCFVSAKHKAATRYRFPIALMLTWFIGGNLLAILLASAGPCYYGAITGLTDPYAGQLAILSSLDAESPIRAVQYQAMLWGVYESPSVGFGGISAMPSMHCATSFLLILLAWKHKAWRYAAIAFFLFILLSSVMLAWHYAVDGLLAIPVALFGWWIAGKTLTWSERR